MSIGYYYHTFVIGQRLLAFVPGQAGNFGIGQLDSNRVFAPPASVVCGSAIARAGW